MNQISLNNNNNNQITFSGLQATQKGARKLVETFKDSNNMNFFKNAITLAKNNISADILVKENEILVKPHELTNYATMRMRDITDDRDVYRVDYFEHDIHKALDNGAYTIDNYLDKMPDIRNYEYVGLFGKLFEGACRIAEDLDKKFHNKITKVQEKEIALDEIVKTLGIDIVDK